MKNLKLLILLILIFIQIDLKPQSSIPIIQITSSSAQKSETSVTVNPIDDNNLFVGTNVSPDRIGFYYSSNSGADWTENDNFDNEVRTDPGVAYDLLGNLFYI
jgi:hypothetical protein